MSWVEDAFETRNPPDVIAQPGLHVLRTPALACSWAKSSHRRLFYKKMLNIVSFIMRLAFTPLSSQNPVSGTLEGEGTFLCSFVPTFKCSSRRALLLLVALTRCFPPSALKDPAVRSRSRAAEPEPEPKPACSCGLWAPGSC